MISFITLATLEIVLGIDNIIFISLFAAGLPPEAKKKAMRFGLAIAFFGRLVLLFLVKQLTQLTEPLFSLSHFEFSVKDLVLILGGLFLLTKSSLEIYEKMEAELHDGATHATKHDPQAFMKVILQITAIDMIFSFDSIITAVAISRDMSVIVTAMLLAMILMLVGAKYFTDLMARHPSIQILGLSFLILLGTVLIAEGFEHEIPRGYIYFALAFSMSVEAINIRIKNKQKPDTMSANKSL